MRCLVVGAAPTGSAVVTGGRVAVETFGVAVDDAHHFDPNAPEPAARPGRAWVEVFGRELSTDAICDGLAKGRLYSSSGVRIRRLRITQRAFSLWPIDQDTVVEFLDRGGKVLARVEPREGVETTYALSGREQSVRARLTRPNGERAWTQAYGVTYLDSLR